MKNGILFTTLLCLFVACSGCVRMQRGQTGEIPAVRDFSLGKYLGTWYEIARLPHSFEVDLTHVKAVYSLRPDGRVKVVNSGLLDGSVRQIEGVAVMEGEKDRGELKVSFFRPFYGSYRIIYLTPDYTVAMVTSDTRDYLWILARTPAIDLPRWRECLKLAEQYEFPTELLQYPNGNPESNPTESKTGGAL